MPIDFGSQAEKYCADVHTIVLAPPPPPLPPHCPPKKVKMEWPELKAYFTDCHSVNGTHTNFVNALCSCEIINVFVNGRIDDGCRNMTTVPLLKTGQRREIKAVVRFLHAEGKFLTKSHDDLVSDYGKDVISKS